MDNCSELSLNCHVHIENLNERQEIVKRQKYLKASLSLWRNEFREIVILLTKSAKLEPLKYVLQDVKIHSKFMKEGKSTLILANHNVRLLLSNCPPADLKRFFQVLSVKLANFKVNGKVSQRKKLLAGLPKAFEEISPINEKDINTVNNMRKENEIKINEKAAGGKRKQPFSDQTNMTSGSKQTANVPPSKKRMLVLPTDNLSIEQKHVLKMIKRGKNVFLTGSAGTGKSFLLRHIIGMLPPSHTAVTASTGVAACHIGGMTLHSFVGIKESMPFNQAITCVRNHKAVARQWKTCKHLIIDEISMIDADFFDCIEAIARAVRGSTDPFGGIQLIICGDFFQLPPVSKSTDKKKFCFQAKSWQKCIEYNWELHKIYRQTDDRLIQVLQDIRIGKCDPKSIALLKATASNKTEHNGITATKLCTHIKTVKQTNEYYLHQLSGDSKTFQAIDSSTAFSSILDKLLPDTQSIELKVGAQVMLTKNIDVTNGLVNGARGIVVSFTNTEVRLPVIRFLSGPEKAIKYESYSLKISSDITAFRKQLPLKLAWAISIHKSQGMSLDCVEMSLSRVFENGQAYVALSRAKSLKGLRVLDFNASCVRSSVDVLRFYRHLRMQQKCEIRAIQSF